MSASGAGQQPFLNEETVVIVAPTQVWSARSGDYWSSPIHGLYHADWRLIRSGELRVDGRPIELAGVASGPGSLTVRGLARSLDDDTPDPRVLIEWHRTVAAGAVEERVRVVNGLAHAVRVPIELAFEIEFAEMQTIKAGRHVPAPIAVEMIDDEVVATDGPRVLRLRARGGQLSLRERRVSASVVLEVPARGTAETAVAIEVADADAVVGAGEGTIADLPPSGDAALDRWAAQALADCRALLLDAGQGPFVAAGTPWFLTLFGRDSLITARFLLPVSTQIAGATLRTLAARQGTVVDSNTAEQPGKILHEVRAGVLEVGDGVSLPPVYYGTIDATGLWVILLHDAWRAGLPDDEVRALLPALHAALGWLRDDGCPDESGFLKYLDATGHGLANQGWKDSGDSIRFRDGSIAEGPIALAEVQAQACLAAECGAVLLDAFGGDGAPWRDWAEAMRSRFRERFWVEQGGVRFPAIALDGQGRPVDSKTSNIGQLIGTTLLSPDEEAALADLLVDPVFASGFGLRTMASDEGGFWPLSYHCGSVWTHDTAVAIEGLLKAGLRDQAKVLAGQLLRAADAFGSRAPELFAGLSADEASSPVAYPASCRPQGWSAAAVVPVYQALTT
ncbi:glycogen debranching N-terminal domain-containing protein [Tessaracoccus caeni]|uniref:glycogen debranching N-terminal domain-containing protein n=1 Tax=Tessaracoccus caeni TaxID=3031239 RepID=UPI0023D9822A|nr:glycogen debranching N-terminal domain-containing protein [Tessaracoccus caeni]MDF1487266.1 glycogen debranching N-terminal domain-containing protein [Tessaracoccus caeni]